MAADGSCSDDEEDINTESESLMKYMPLVISTLALDSGDEIKEAI